MRRCALALPRRWCSAFAAPAAHASLKLCNRTSYVLYAATASATASDALVQGWTRIVPGECSVALKGDLAARPIISMRAPRRPIPARRAPGAGISDFCVKDTDFSLRQPLLSSYCPAPDMFKLPFAASPPITCDRGRRRSDETPDYDSMQSAERAGVETAAGRHRRTRSAVTAHARTKHRTRRSPPSANACVCRTRPSTDDLFDALETEAMKTAAPIGYTVCNDTDKPVWAALGQKKGAVFVSRGWWTVAPGGCARTITDAAGNRKIYLRREKAKSVGADRRAGQILRHRHRIRDPGPRALRGARL